MKHIVAVVFFLVFSLSATAQQRPNLFLVGDSISIYYTPDLTADLASFATLTRKMSPSPETIKVQLGDPNVQGGNSTMVLDYLRGRYKEAAFHPSVVLINCGLHDVKRDPKTHAIAIEAPLYEANLNAMDDLITAHGGTMIWISSTPVDDARHNALSKDFLRYDADVQHYNEIAATVSRKRHIPVVDLYTFTAHFGNTHYIDHVHYDEGTRALQAAYIAGFVQSWLEEHPQHPE